MQSTEIMYLRFIVKIFFFKLTSTEKLRHCCFKGLLDKVIFKQTIKNYSNWHNILQVSSCPVTF